MDAEIRRRPPTRSANPPHVGVKFGRLVEGIELPPDVPFSEMPAAGFCAGDPGMYEMVLARGRAMRHGIMREGGGE